MKLIFFEDDDVANLLPLTFTRHTAQLRVGIWTIEEKWRRASDHALSYMAADHLDGLLGYEPDGDDLYINGGVIPSPELIDQVVNLEPESLLSSRGQLIAYRASSHVREGLEARTTNAEFLNIQRPWDLFVHNEQALIWDFSQLEGNSSSVGSEVAVLGDQLFVEEGADVSISAINAKTGPVYIGRDATVMEGVMIRGPFAMGEGSVLKMGAKIYGPTTLGPYCKVGGEVTNSIFFGYSNKGHDGFVGNSVIGEWCNLGADTNTSNLKNNYSEVSVWNYKKNDFEPTGRQFCGLIMGDHAKTGINTMLNTGTVVGVGANVFDAGFPPKFIPAFSWGKDLVDHDFDKAIETARRMMGRRGVELQPEEVAVLRRAFDADKSFRQS